MRALAVAAVNIRRLFRDRSNIFFVFLLPIGIIVIIGSMFGGAATPKIGVLSAGAGALGDQLVAALETQEGIAVQPYDDEDALLLAVERGDVVAGVEIPPDYDAAVRAGEQVEVGFVSRPSGDGPALRATVEAVIAEQSQAIRAARFAQEQGAGSFDQLLATAESLRATAPGVTVTDTTRGEALFTNLGQFDLGASSQLVLFMYLTGLTGAAALIETRRLGVSKRMLATPTSTRSIIVGEGLGRYGVVLVQGVYILLVTLIAFGVDWGDPLGAVAIIILFGAVCAGAAMLMGTLFQNDQQAGGIGVILGLGFAALGGCMIPIEFFSDTMRTVAHFTPHAWAIDGFSELVRRHGTILDILPELGVLAAFAVAFIGIASWRLRLVLTRA